MNQANFLQRMNELITGDGFIREIPIPLSAVISTGASAPALSSNLAVVTFDADDESITIPFQVPLDYSESQDELAVVITAELTTGDNSTNAIALDLDEVWRARPGEAAADELSDDVTSDSQGVAVTVEQYTFDMSGLNLKPGDVLSIEIDAQETGTAVATIYGAAIRYRSSLASDDQDFRSEVDKPITND